MDSPYCEICNCCAELPCCGVGKFLKHGKDCKYFEIYKKEILDSLEIVNQVDDILHSDQSIQEKLTNLHRLFP